MTRALNLSTGKEKYYTCSPEEAVICAYAQERKDYSTWEYNKRYSHLVERGKVTVTCGDWSAIVKP